MRPNSSTRSRRCSSPTRTAASPASWPKDSCASQTGHQMTAETDWKFTAEARMEVIRELQGALHRALAHAGCWRCRQDFGADYPHKEDDEIRALRDLEKAYEGKHE